MLSSKPNLAPGATAKTDGWSGYPGAPGVNHNPHVVGNMAAHHHSPGRTASSPTLKSGPWASITACAGSHLQTYLDEFVFRFNRRRTRHAAFRSLLGIAAAHTPLPYKMLISPEARV